MQSLNANRAGLAAGIVAAALVLLCGLLVMVAPGGALALFNLLAHGTDLGPIYNPQVGFGDLLLSMAVGFVGAWVVVSAFAWVYNRLAR